MPYVITNDKNFICINKENQQSMTAELKQAKFFDYEEKASKYIKCLKRTLQKFQWKVIYIGKEVTPPKPNTDKKLHSKVNISLGEDMQEILEMVRQLHSKLKNIKTDEEKEMVNGIATTDRAILNTLHDIEFDNLNASAGYKQYAKIRDIRRKRRKFKDRLYILQTLQDSNISKILYDNIITKIDDMDCREYKIRTEYMEMFSD